jgi:hypothetical protein
MKKTSTFTGKKTDSTTLKAPPPPRPPPPPPIRKTSKKPDPLRNTTTGSNVEETNADEWERTELDKIKRRYLEARLQ